MKNLEVNNILCSNGLKIILIPTITKVVGISLFINKGGINDDDGTLGTAHFVEHMMFKGSKNRPGEQLIDSTREMGLYFNASTRLSSTRYDMLCIHEYTEQSIDILFDMFLNPVFTERDFNMEKEVVMQEYWSTNSTNDDAMDRIMTFNMFRGKYNRPVIGTTDTINSITSKDINNYIKNNYKLKNCVLVISGYIDDFSLLKCIKNIINKYTREEISMDKYDPIIREPIDKIIPKNTDKNIIVKIDKQATQCHLLMNFKCYGSSNNKYMIMDIIFSYLSDGVGARLFKILRDDNGLAYGVRSNFSLLVDDGYCGFELGVTINKVEFVIELILQVLKEMKEKELDKKDLKISKNTMKRIIYSYTTTTDNILSNYGFSEIAGLEFDTDQMIKYNDNITQKDIMELSKEIFTKDNLLIVSNVAVNEDKIDELIKKYL